MREEITSVQNPKIKAALKLMDKQGEESRLPLSH